MNAIVFVSFLATSLSSLIAVLPLGFRPDIPLPARQRRFCLSYLLAGFRDYGQPTLFFPLRPPNLEPKEAECLCGFAHPFPFLVTAPAGFLPTPDVSGITRLDQSDSAAKVSLGSSIFFSSDSHYFSRRSCHAIALHGDVLKA